jgi:hypothetical protein
MALRVYSDGDGNEWRAWPVTPSTGASTLGISYRDGWLCFERVDGSDRRRLAMAQVPPAWDALPDDRLEVLCRMAEPASRRPPSATGGDVADARKVETQQRDARKSGPKSAIGGDEETT